MSKRILIFSDNHSETKIMNEIITSTPHDLVVHAGDYMVDVATMKLHFDYFVDGNNDYDYKPIQLFTCEKCKFLLVHGDQQFAFDQKL
jgi:predicted phosphodiesterase